MTIDQARFLRTVARWHRRFALFVCLWLVLLALSGILINHGHDWRLDRSPLPPAMQHLFYDIESTTDDFCSAVPAIGVDCAEVFASLTRPGGQLLLSKNSIFVLDEQRQLVEKLAVAQLGLGNLEAGLRKGSWVYLRDAHRIVRSDPELMEWETLDGEAAGGLSAESWLNREAAAETITWERLFLDLHAARFLGPLAQSFTDLMAVLILVLALSGIWLWRFKRKQN